MVVTGLSRIHIAKYAENGGNITYSDCVELARARGMTINVETTDSNNFYANNAVAETDGPNFKSGTADIEVDGLSGEEEKLINGTSETTVEFDGKQIQVLDYGATATSPYFGIGGIRREKMNGVDGWRPILLTKAKFSPTSDEMKSQEEEIDWQPKALSATIMRDDSVAHNWKRITSEPFESEEKAAAFLKLMLGETT